ncbi:superinfection exclusion protein [Escherichia phage vB_Eco_AL25]|uniref:Superinfection exclusion protein n=1 Tax=Escherichia phage PMBT57 TaxID=2079259 RepID=A0A2K9VA73_9CAUD|nr:superinfection exclusion protein [Escherichia phage PMBT57]QXV75831.1 superinfection exclusion protein [Escherichia phage AlfredRasser]CAE6410738.1 hypothetical protein JURA_0053 [Escherichia phage vB_Eco_Jura]CAH0462261.1 superinfection exclusion protein[Escherichiaphage PMBT57] [Escherichia phage vB_Eco_SPSP]CAH6421909.1 superinfection exclusion protein [Escherichia phage vB_Eco_AL25]
MANKNRLRVWHIPQVPGKAFYVEVDSVEEGVRIIDILANYDLFQYENNIKGDYCNVSGLQMYDEHITDDEMEEMGLTDRWVDWYYEDDQSFFDNPKEYLNNLKK